MRVGVVGAGYFARYQIAAWDRLPGVDLVGVADTDPKARAQIAEAHPGCSTVETLQQLLQDPPDILDIATPPMTHAPLIEAALGHVPTVICQKPFCETLDQAKAVTHAAEASDTRLLVHENFRFQPWYREAKRLIDKGLLGSVAQARFALRPGDGGGPDAYLGRQPYFRQMPRFLIRETGIHFIDLFRFLFGPPRAVYADLRRLNPAIAGEDAGIVVFDIQAGGRAVFDGNRTLGHAAANRRLTMGELEIEGTDASLRLTGDGTMTLRQADATDWDRHRYHFEDRDFGGNCVEAFQAHVLAALAGVRPFETQAREYLANLEVEAMVYASAEDGRKKYI